MAGVRLEVIAADKLDIDPDVQFAFALSERRWRQMGAAWNPAKQGVLEVTPMSNGSNGYWVFDGRHRLLGGRDIAGVKEFRCNVHWPSLSPQEKAERKLGLDRDRRAVRPIESFLTSVIAEDPQAVDIKRIVEEAGYRVGKTGGNRDDRNIEAVGVLNVSYRKGLLARVLAVNSLWIGEPKTNQAVWLWGMVDFCSNGYDQNLSDSQRSALQQVVPALVWRKAVGKSTTVTTQNSNTGSEVSRLIAEELRRVARIRRPRRKTDE